MTLDRTGKNVPPREGTRRPPAAAPSSPITIGVIDTDWDLVLILAEVFSEMGWKTVPFSSTVAGFAALRTAPPDVILLDLWLHAASNGWRLLKEVLDDAVLGSVPIIICSGAPEQLRDRAQWLEERGFIVLPKPFDIEELYEAVGAAFAGRIAWDEETS